MNLYLFVDPRIELDYSGYVWGETEKGAGVTWPLFFSRISCYDFPMTSKKTSKPKTPKKKASRAKKSRGRPSLYTIELRNKICSRLASGETMRSICRDEDMPDRQTVYNWLQHNVKEDKEAPDEESFFDHYTRARDIGLDVMADDILDIADDGTNDFRDKKDKDGNVIGEELDREHVMRSNLRVDTRKWYLSKMAPKRYGDSKMLLHGNVDDKRPVQFVVKTGIDRGDDADGDEGS